jgi:GH24 family phage-related lysozyme (muramidase)
MIAILKHEAIVLSTYKDRGGVLTIGAGHTATAGEPIPVRGLTISLDRALALFIKDLEKFERRVGKAIRTPLNQESFDALVSFDFNTGAIDKGTVDDRWNAGDVTGALRVLKSYKKDNGKVVKGLETRRLEEATLISQQAYPPVKTIDVYDKYPGKVRKVDVAQIRTALARCLDQRRKAPDVVAQQETAAPAAQEIKPVGSGTAGATAGGTVATGGALLAAGFDAKWILAGMVTVIILGVVIFIVRQNNP